MLTTPSTTGPSHENQPLLQSRTAKTYVNLQSDLEVAPTADQSPEEAGVAVRKVDFRRIFWYLTIAALVGAVLSGVIWSFESSRFEVGDSIQPSTTPDTHLRLCSVATVRL
jgi:hypothetical protein